MEKTIAALLAFRVLSPQELPRAIENLSAELSRMALHADVIGAGPGRVSAQRSS